MRARGGKRLPNWAIGLVMLVVLAVASYVAFTKSVPWGGGTEVTAVFNSAQNLRPNSPVRIAGVEVGKVTKVEPLDPDNEDGEAATGSVPTGAEVTMEIDDDGLPFKEDAQFTLKPRLFLEGNLFVDVQPGSPSSPDDRPRGLHVSGIADGEHGPARPDPHRLVPGGLAARTCRSSSTSSARLSSTPGARSPCGP